MSASRRVRRGAAVLSAAVLVGVAGCSNGGGDDADEVELTEYESTDLTAPPIDLDSTDDDRSDEYFFVGPKSQETGLWSGKLIVDEDGEPVWIQEDEESDGSSEPTAGWDMRVQEYEGEKVLTWWEGIVDTPLAEGEVVVVDDSYEEIARVGMGNDLPHRMVDLHETTITDEGTMLLMAYVPKQADLTEIGGESDGWVWDGVVQEVDIETGESCSTGARSTTSRSRTPSVSSRMTRGPRTSPTTTSTATPSLSTTTVRCWWTRATPMPSTTSTASRVA